MKEFNKRDKNKDSKRLGNNINNKKIQNSDIKIIKPKLKIVHILFFVIVFLFIFFAVGFGVVFASFSKVDIEKIIMQKELAVPTNIFDIKGRLIAQIYLQHREIIPLREMPQYLIDAFIAYEDSKFYQHHGFNIKRTIGAFIKNIQNKLLGRKAFLQGGSTITQQLAKRLFTESEKTIFRKLKELWYAVQIEKHFSKNEILELYLNEIYFGHGAYGIQAASKLYFNKDARDLTLGECAILAMIPQSPYYHSPILFPENARKRQKIVLNRMVELGFITKKQAEEAYTNFWLTYSQKKFTTGYSSYSYALNKAPYYVDAVRRIIENDFTPEEIYKKGLNVYTAVDIDYQQAALRIIQKSLNKWNKYYQKRREEKVKYFLGELLDMTDLFFETNNIYTNLGEKKLKIRFKKLYAGDLTTFFNLIASSQTSASLAYKMEKLMEKINESMRIQLIQSALVSIDPTTGYVLALVGGGGWSLQNQFNRAILGKFQPGSSIKPFIYAAAFDRKLITPSTIILDAPIIYYFGDNEWRPVNYSGKYYGYVTVRDALRKSINIVAIKVLEYLTPGIARRYVAKFYGINENRVPPYLSLALGTVLVRPIEEARAYATLANYGKQVFPIIVRYVTDREGKILKNYESEINEKYLNTEDLAVVSPQAAFLTTSVLMDTDRPGGTAYYFLRPFNLKFEHATKTGTTQFWKDAWFVGYTPNLATVVWTGFDKYYTLGKGLSGSKVSGPVWAEFMKYVYEVLKRPVKKFYIPANILRLRVDAESGLLASPISKSSYYEYFINGTQPKKYADGVSYFTFKDESDIEGEQFFKNIMKNKEEKQSETNTTDSIYMDETNTNTDETQNDNTTD